MAIGGRPEKAIPVDWSEWYADRETWPESEHIFLADAVMQLGAAMCFPWYEDYPEWAMKGDMPDFPGPFDAFEADGSPVLQVHDAFGPLVRSVISPAAYEEMLLRQDVQAWTRSHVRDPLDDAPTPALLLRARAGEDAEDPITYDHWTEATATASEATHLRDAARQALRAVAKGIVRLTQARSADDRGGGGGIEMLARSVDGGDYVDLPPETWRLDDPVPRIAVCGLNLDRPFDRNAERTHLIFVKRQGFEAAIKAYAYSNGIALHSEGEGTFDHAAYKPRDKSNWPMLQAKVEQVMREYLDREDTYNRKRPALLKAVEAVVGRVSPTIFEGARSALVAKYKLDDGGAPRHSPPPILAVVPKAKTSSD